MNHRLPLEAQVAELAGEIAECPDCKRTRENNGPNFLCASHWLDTRETQTALAFIRETQPPALPQILIPSPRLQNERASAIETEQEFGDIKERLEVALREVSR